MIFSPSEDGSFYFDDISEDEKSGSVLASSVFYGLAALQLRVTSSPPLCTFYQVDNYFPIFLLLLSVWYFQRLFVLKLPLVNGGNMSQFSRISGFNEYECVCVQQAGA